MTALVADNIDRPGSEFGRGRGRGRGHWYLAGAGAGAGVTAGVAYFIFGKAKPNLGDTLIKIKQFLPLNFIIIELSITGIEMYSHELKSCLLPYFSMYHYIHGIENF